MKNYCILLVIVLTACSTAKKAEYTSCDVGVFNKNGMPCWVNHTPTQGIVVNMPQHIDPTKTRDVLFKKALLELAAAKEGVDISEDAIVKKRVQVIGDNVKQKAEVISLATVKTSNGSINIKAKVKDDWTHPTSRKLYLWVVNVD